MRTGNQPAVLWPAELKSGEVSEAVSPGRRAGEGRQGRENYREVRRVSVTLHWWLAPSSGVGEHPHPVSFLQTLEKVLARYNPQPGSGLPKSLLACR